MSGHWTNESTYDFVSAINIDFMECLSNIMEKKCISEKDLADRLGYSEEYVRSLFANSENLTIEGAVSLCRAIGCKVSLVPYDDGDSENVQGPVFADVFSRCWERFGKPTN